MAATFELLIPTAMTKRTPLGVLKATFVLCALLTAGPLVAAILTVSNDPNRPAMYTDVITAHNAANDNDTIFLFGTPSGIMGSGNITKPLYIIGNGYDPNQPSLRSRLSILTLDPSSSGTVLEGLYMARLVVNGTATVRNCEVRFTSGVQSLITIGTSGQLTATNNLFVRDENGLSTGFFTIDANTNNTLGQLFHNNVIIFNNHNGGGNNCIQDVRNGVFSNNVFLSWDANESSIMQGGNQDNVFTNNIFYNVFTVSSGCNACGFMNNLVSGCVDCNLITGSQTGSGTILDTPVFVGGYTSGSWSYTTQDLGLQDLSPGENAGTDGLDVGLYGGDYPMIPGTAHNQTLSVIPYITSFNLENPVIPQLTGGPLQITSGAIINQ
ncbi:MAG: hypothetical protein IPJ76_03640 [Flavobacteriales bacterium]|nr:MAG: hypothetical protein IPJ76_03640 [Flavobacteriales bacterium]